MNALWSSVIVFDTERIIFVLHRNQNELVSIHFLQKYRNVEEKHASNNKENRTSPFKKHRNKPWMCVLRTTLWTGIGTGPVRLTKTATKVSGPPPGVWMQTRHVPRLLHGSLLTMRIDIGRLSQPTIWCSKWLLLVENGHGLLRYHIHIECTVLCASDPLNLPINA